MRPLIAVSVNLMSPDPDRRLYKGKSLQYVERAMVDWVWRYGGHPVVIPMINEQAHLDEVVARFDGLVVTGGQDISPAMYADTARRPEWAGQPDRDAYERDLILRFSGQDKPILGICRGHQMINVAFGGSMHQDLIEEGAAKLTHRCQERYDSLSHDVRFADGSWFAEVFGSVGGRINSVHHQGVRELGSGLVAEAHAPDGVIEGIRHPQKRFIVGAQWHPEWATDRFVEAGMLSSAPLFGAFIAAASD